MTGTFPLNVQAGSPQYTLASDITPASSTTLITITYTDPIEPITNAYYTIQNADGSKWCTFYVSNWRVGDSPMTYYLSCTYSSSNTSDVFPEGSVCWCIWCKEYYDSLITKIGSGGNTVKVSQLEWDTNLVIPDGRHIETPSITVDGYTPEVVTKTGNSFSITDLTVHSIPITPDNVTLTGSVGYTINGTRVTVILYAKCFSAVGANDVQIGSDYVSSSGSTTGTINISSNIPKNTTQIQIYATLTKDILDVTLNNININSSTYTSTALI